MDELKKMENELKALKEKKKTIQFKKLKEQHKHYDKKYNALKDEKENKKTELREKYFTNNGKVPIIYNNKYSGQIENNIKQEVKTFLKKHINLKLLTNKQIEEIVFDMTHLAIENNKDIQDLEDKADFAYRQTQAVSNKIDEVQNNIWDIQHKIKSYMTPEQKKQDEKEEHDKLTAKQQFYIARRKEEEKAREMIPKLVKQYLKTGESNEGIN